MKQVYTDLMMLVGYGIFAVIFMMMICTESFGARFVLKDKTGNQTARCYTDSKGNWKCFTN